MDRRTFLKYQAAGLLGLAGSASLLAPLRALADGRPDVAVVKGQPAAATRAAVELLGGMGRFVKAGQKVLIKPNMSFAKGLDSATTTHPEVVKALVIMCREAGAGRIRVLDHSLQDPEETLAASGILAACDGVEKGLCRHLMDDSFYLESDFPQGLEMRSNAIMREALEAEVIIAAPVAKSHGATGVSLSLKGQMGLIMDRRIMHSRYSLDQSIVDLNTRLKPHLAVIDATRVLTTNGPGGPGLVITPGEVIASADPVAADATAVAAYEWYGRKIEPRQVSHLVAAHERGLGRMDIGQLLTRRLEI
ncbi:MAG: DUF362 domain-containing protein [Candidatus Adiutrix sp.]|jgi:uncharacterized protein (DUF362 family)|nr:DUF362 domain-containing protein [Candidatus Adiutrix sp.]